MIDGDSSKGVAIDEFDDVKENLIKNFENYAGNEDDLGTEWGICRPGKDVAQEFYKDQHISENTDNLTTDYISQIAPCNSSQNNKKVRTQSCPIFEMRKFIDTDLDEENENPTSIKHFLSAKTMKLRRLMVLVSPQSVGISLRREKETKLVQMDGMSLNDPIEDSGTSNFRPFELSNPQRVLRKGIPENACLRKAGSICHTNLDCAPNAAHAEIASTLDP